MSRALFALSEEQQAIQETARRFAAERLASGYRARDAAGRLDRALVREMGAIGLIGVDLPRPAAALAPAG